MKIGLFLFLLFTQVLTYSYERSDAFILEVESDHYKVLSPTNVDKNSAVIIKNKMLTKLRGKLVSQKDGDIKYLSIKPRSTKSFQFPYDKKTKYFFIPLSPPFQAVDLRLGQKSYEIPEKR